MDDLLKSDILIASDGFGLCRLPKRLLDAVRDSGVTGLTFVPNNAGIDNEGIGIRTLVASDVSKDITVTPRNENGMLGIGPFPSMWAQSSRAENGPRADCRR